MPTIQGELERAIGILCTERVRVTGAGRTDAGVHATGQTVSFHVTRTMDDATLRRGVNALLPTDIAVLALEPAVGDFHARFSATCRIYEYRIRNAPVRRPLERLHEQWVPHALDHAALDRAATLLVGTRDFTAFASGPGGIRTVRQAGWGRDDDGIVRFRIEADAFLRGMVRAIVGTLLWVGRRKISVERFGEVLASRDRAQAGPSAPAAGLCLAAVEYGERSRANMREHEEGAGEDE